MSSTVTPRKRPASSSPPPSASAGDPSTRASRGNGNESPFLASRNGAGMGLGVTRGRDGEHDNSLPTPTSSKRSTPSKRPIQDLLPTPCKQPVFTTALPTPPRTPHHKRAPSTSTTNLPSHLHTLLSLHRALDLSLSLHVATHPPILPPISERQTDGSAVVKLESLVSFVGVKESVERISGRNFGMSELRRLRWIWDWDGNVDGVPEEFRNGGDGKGKSKQRTEDNDPFSAPSSSENNIKTSSSYLLTPTRTIDPRSSRRTHTYGIGITLVLTPPEVVSAGNTLLGSRGVGSAAGMGAVGRWSAGGERRAKEVDAKLRKWVEMTGGSVDEVQGHLPTPTRTPQAKDVLIPQIPFATLPPLPTSSGNLLPAFTLASESAKTSTKSIPPPPGVEEDVFGPVIALPPPSGRSGKAKPGSVEERRQALYDRIKARANNTASLSTGGKLALSNVSAAGMQNELKRRSTLSRLEGVAESVWMLFSTSTCSGVSSSPGTSPRARRRALPTHEVADVVVKSSKTPISTAEARDSLILLTQLCPMFLVQRIVAKQEWLEMPAAAHRIAGSPGGVVAGPASPGKVVVRGGGGLREVRERIRRELGE